MSKIASLSSKLREKDSEKSKILNDIKDLEALKTQKIVGQLLFTVTSIGSISSEFIIDLKVTPSEYNLSVVKLTNLVSILFKDLLSYFSLTSYFFYFLFRALEKMLNFN